ncbi:MAG: ketoacyl-ACP synthase III [Elusimicrobia bacterium CG08_land_8_20_14_0_20_51_18]|nr:MAG: ketoacyl-ACP synthase III [Elusimicrobia bacterium CG08_land_8_20_14_0_20_51_18]
MFRIKGTGMYLPKNLVSNEYFYGKFGDDPLKKVFERIGHGARYYADKDESSATLAINAGREALKNSGMSPEDIDLLIISTDTPSQLSPATAAQVQHELGLKNAGAFDMNCACAGFVTALDMASKYLDGADYRNAMVIGTYAMSKHLDPDDGGASILFGDGAGAFVLGYAPEQKGKTASALKADGSYWDFMGIYGGGTARPVDEKVLAEKSHKVKVHKKFPATLNSDEWPPLIKKTLGKLDLKPQDAQAYVFTQIRKPTIVEVMEGFSLPMERTHTIMEKWGYTGSACVPMAFHDMISAGKVKRGDRVVLCASGGGYAMACMTFIY